MDYDLIIIGAGPVGLALANFVGQAGLQVLVVEQLDALIDYPRGVGMDDECLRAFQAIGLAERVSEHTTPHQWMEFRTAKGRTLALIRPQTNEFGWPRRSAFIQPLVDKVLFDGTKSHATIKVAFGTEFQSLEQDDSGVTVSLTGPDGGPTHVPTTFLWQGRVHVVRGVLAQWTQRVPWWRRQEEGVSGGPSAEVLEQQVWRVEASAGRTLGQGVYDLVQDERWRLERVSD